MSETAAPQGLTAADAQRRLLQYGPNAVAEGQPRAWLALLLQVLGPRALLPQIAGIEQAWQTLTRL